MCCFQTANFSNNQREIPEQVLAFLERRVVFLNPTKHVHTALQTTVISSVGLARLSRKFLSSEGVLVKHPPQHTGGLHSISLHMLQKVPTLPSSWQCTLILLKSHTRLAQNFFFWDNYTEELWWWCLFFFSFKDQSWSILKINPWFLWASSSGTKKALATYKNNNFLFRYAFHWELSSLRVYNYMQEIKLLPGFMGHSESCVFCIFAASYPKSLALI